MPRQHRAALGLLAAAALLAAGGCNGDSFDVEYQSVRRTPASLKSVFLKQVGWLTSSGHDKELVMQCHEESDEHEARVRAQQDQAQRSAESSASSGGDARPVAAVVTAAQNGERVGKMCGFVVSSAHSGVDLQERRLAGQSMSKCRGECRENCMGFVYEMIAPTSDGTSLGSINCVLFEGSKGENVAFDRVTQCTTPPAPTQGSQAFCFENAAHTAAHKGTGDQLFSSRETQEGLDNVNSIMEQSLRGKLGVASEKQRADQLKIAADNLQGAVGVTDAAALKAAGKEIGIKEHDANESQREAMAVVLEGQKALEEGKKEAEKDGAREDKENSKDEAKAAKDTEADDSEKKTDAGEVEAKRKEEREDADTRKKK